MAESTERVLGHDEAGEMAAMSINCFYIPSESQIYEGPPSETNIHRDAMYFRALRSIWDAEDAS